MDENNESAWASRRKSVYLGLLVLVLTAVSFGIFWKFWYTTPTCFDGLKNGNETGVDCGGSCTLVCKADILKPIVRWDPRVFEVLPNLWSVLVYVENPNIDTVAVYAPYTFTLYDENNNIILTREGATVLPKNKTVGVFEGSISIDGGKKPKRATFDLRENIVWKKSSKKDSEISITHTPLLRLDSAPRVEANVKNNGIEDIKNIELVIAIFDGQDNAVAASRTFIPTLKKGENSNIFFTWPKPFDLGSKICEKPANIALLIDKSGSMSSISQNPPEPLTQSKMAAVSFIKQLTPNDSVSLISFATEASKPIDLSLTNDFASAEQAVDSIGIDKNGVQYTNIYDAIHSAWQELVTPRASTGATKVAVLLTDGVATHPKNPQGGSEAQDIKYAEGLALKEAESAKKDGLKIYTIGLGSGVNENFLKQIASEEQNYFFAPSAQNLESIYKNISSDICKEVPSRIEITYKILDANAAAN